MTRVGTSFLLLSAVFLLSSGSLLVGQEVWRLVPSEYPGDHQDLPFARAIGVPATATYKGQTRKAFFIIHGTDKRAQATLPPHVHLVPPGIEIHIDGLDDLLPPGRADLFDGPDDGGDSTEIRAMEIRISRGSQVLRAKQSVDRYLGNYPDSFVGPDGNVLGTGSFPRGPERTAWMQVLREMSKGFDKGQISIGGRVLSPNIEIQFSSKGIEPLLKELLSVCYQ